MSYECIEVTQQNHVTSVLLNRPDAMNAITPEMHHELQDAFDVFSKDEDQFVAVIRGAGDRAFCAGSDLKTIAAGGFKAYPKSGYAGLIERFDLNKPLIVAVDGFALGGGFEVALACDMIVATHRSSFGLPEPLVGAVALGGGIHRLARQIGLKQAMGMVLTADRVSADEGFRMGFVNQVVDGVLSMALQLPAVKKLGEEIGINIGDGIKGISDQVSEQDNSQPASESSEDQEAFDRWKSNQRK